MAFTIPNSIAANYPAQAEPDSLDFTIMTAVAAGSGVVSGCAVSQNSPTALNVLVASGVIAYNGVTYALASGTVNLTTADATNPRFDLIVGQTSGTATVVTGTPAVHPVFPALPANEVVLAAIYVGANTTNITNQMIVDKRAAIFSPTQQSQYNVKTYGAVGNYSNDDTTAIQNAINDASVNGGTVYFPVGTYRITGTLTVNADNVALVGAGWGAQIKAANAFAPTLMLWYKAPNSGYRQGCRISNLSFHGNQSGSLTSMIQLDSLRWALLDNLEIQQHPTIGIYMNSSNGTFGAYNTIRDCVFHDSYTGIGVKTNNSEWLNLQNCRFLLYNLSGAYGFWTQNLNCNVTACMFDAMDTAVYMFFGQYNNITGCQFDEGNTNFVHLSNTNTCTIVGNTYNQHTGTGTDAIYVDGGSSYGNVIANNVLKTTTGWTNFYKENSDTGTPGNTIIGNDCGSATIVLHTGTARSNRGYNPVGKLGPPAVPATTVAYTNAYGVDATVHVAGGTVTAISIGGNATGLTSGTFRVLSGETITLTYSVAPTWTWFGD